MAYYIGIDIGGTNIKTGVVSETGEIISETGLPTGAHRPQNTVFEDIVQTVKTAIEKSGVNKDEIHAIGMGSPGMINYENGSVIYNNNLGWKDFHISEMMSERFGIPARLENDADAAALGEVIAGSAKNAQSAMIITLGTGVGAGFVIGEKIYRGSEFGHMVIKTGGRHCKCGRDGCFESYCSATGVINITKEAIAENPDGLLAKTAELEGEISGRTMFDAADKGDPLAIKLVDEYIDNLACGIANIVNGLNPEIISLSGGIAKRGEKLLVPLREKVMSEIYVGLRPTASKIVCCTLGYKAGLIGAAMAVRNFLKSKFA